MEQDQERAHISDSLALAQQPLGTSLISEQASLLSDVPSERDLLNYTDYRDALVSVIRRLDVDVPLTMGVFGAWGSGKTTLLSLQLPSIGLMVVGMVALPSGSVSSLLGAAASR